MIKPIVTIEKKEDEKFLREKTKEFNIETLKDKKKGKEIRGLLKTMRESMVAAYGIGLSANQIGIPQKFFVAQVPDKEGRQKFYAVFNPEIIKSSKEMETMDEGCLSIPGVYGPVERNYRITLSGYDKNGKKIKINAVGLLARVFQHETDHLMGTLFTDKAKHVFETEETESRGNEL